MSSRVLVNQSVCTILSFGEYQILWYSVFILSLTYHFFRFMLNLGTFKDSLFGFLWFYTVPEHEAEIGVRLIKYKPTRFELINMVK